MITFFRRMFTSRFGTIFALAFLVMIGFAFALSDVTGSMGTTTVSGGNVARAGDRQISTLEMRQRVQRAYEAALQRQPGLTMAQFLEGDTLDRLIRETAEVFALEQYARAHGISIDKQSVDALIARNPAFAGPDGSFSEEVFQQQLQQQGFTVARLRAELENQFVVRQLVAPFGQIGAMPASVTLPYANLLLEERRGQAVFVPASRYEPTAAPTRQQLESYYRSQRARYTIPERRTIRYAILDQRAVGTLPPVTPADLQAEYTANAAEYAARETRRMTQVIAGTRAAADQILAAVRGGESLGAAARAAGLAASPVAASSREEYAAATNAATAQAAFAAAPDALIGPLQVPLGWLIVRVDAVERTAARSLAQATPELTARLTERRRQEAMVDVYNSVQDALNGGATVAEVAQDKRLTIQTTPPLLNSGLAPTQPAFRPEPLLMPIVSAAFQAHEGDTAQIITLQENTAFALVEVASITPAAPPPLASVTERVTADWRRAEGARVARDRARAILTAVEAGQSLSAAASAAGTPATVQSIGSTRINLTRDGERVPPEIALLFSMPRGSVKTLEMPGNAGWMVIVLNDVVRGDASSNTDLLQAVQSQFGQALGAEYVGILVAAARAEFPVEIDQAAVAALRSQLTGGGNAN